MSYRHPDSPHACWLISLRNHSEHKGYKADFIFDCDKGRFVLKIRETMNTITVLALLGSLLTIPSAAHKGHGKCLPGAKHKESPSAEESMAACKSYKDASCCTSDFTRQLATPPIKKVGNFSWTPCNKTLSTKCEAFMVMVECFYRCSHNAYFWKNPYFTSAITKAPVCSGFCDGWFDACKDDLTCAKNWITDFKMEAGVNNCKQPCKNFSDYYANGKDLCESMWGASFVYKKTNCLQMNFTSPNPNDALVEKLSKEKQFSSKVHPTGESSGAVFFATSLAIVWIPLIAFFY